jgi:molybdopterin converting factor subunit 1
MKVRVQYFGLLREALGQGAEVELDDGATVGLLLQRLRTGANQAVWAGIAVAVNCEYANRERVLVEGDDVAFLPPVSGGCTAGYRAERRTVGDADAD